jgi:hypothetical protein
MLMLSTQTRKNRNEYYAYYDDAQILVNANQQGIVTGIPHVTNVIM